MARAYIATDVTFRDTAEAEIYRTRAQAAIAKHGGRYPARRGAIQELESVRAPRAWYRSPESPKELEVRDQELRRNLILVEGMAPQV